MSKLIQKRSVATRAKLIAAATDVISTHGFGAMRVDDVVHAAGVAKGTFFAHFQDKDALMDLIIGNRIEGCLNDIDALPAPDSVESLIDHLLPLLKFMTSERYVFDVILRHSGAAAKQDIGPIAQTFGRQIMVLEAWLPKGPFRRDVSATILAEGVQAFSLQVMALHFCAINNVETMQARLKVYLDAWLKPQQVLR